MNMENETTNEPEKKKFRYGSPLGEAVVAKIKDRLPALWSEGKSASHIAVILSDELQVSVSKNMICGHARRLDLERRPQPIKRLTPEEKARKLRKQKFNPTPRKKPFWTDKIRIDNIKPEPKPKRPDKAANPIPFEALRLSTCRWPEWDHEEKTTFMYCGSPVVHGQSYCAYHCTFAFSSLRNHGGTHNGEHPTDAPTGRPNGQADSVVRPALDGVSGDAPASAGSPEVSGPVSGGTDQT